MKRIWERYLFFGVIGLLGLFLYSFDTCVYLMTFGDLLIKFHFLALTLTEPWAFLLTCLFAGMSVYGAYGMKSHQ